MLKKPEKKDSPKGRGCICFAHHASECGCPNVSWEDNDEYNKGLEDSEAYYKQELERDVEEIKIILEEMGILTITYQETPYSQIKTYKILDLAKAISERIKND